MAENGMASPAKEDVLKLEEFLPYRLARVAELVSQDFARIYREKAGLTRPEWRVLATIGQFERVTATFICQHSSMHKTKVSRAVAGLEKRGWVRRVEDEDDRRVAYLSLSRKGAVIYGQLTLEAGAFERVLQERIGVQDHQSLLQALSQLERHLVRP